MVKAIKSIWGLIVLVVLIQLVGASGAVVTVGGLDVWYEGLVKPALNPPNWIFGPVWTALYAMMALALWLVLREENGVSKAVKTFVLQLIVNAIWTPLFFGFKRPDLALIDILLLWALIGITIYRFNKISKLAASLLLPYWVWVSFAAYLNFSIYILNS